MKKRLKIAFNNAGFLQGDEDISNIVENLSTSTNNIIINGLLERGYKEIYQFNSSSVKAGKREESEASVIRLGLETKNGKRYKRGLIPLKYGKVACFYTGMAQMELDEFDIIFIRGDDIEANLETVKTLEKAKRPHYINSPRATLATIDKFEIRARAERSELKIPQTWNATEYQEMITALKEIPGKFKVIKARYGFGGKQVWRVTLKTPEKVLKDMLGGCRGGVVVQEYMESIKNGDLRLNVFDGEVLGNGAILRQGRGDMWKTNIDLGGLRSAYDMDEKISAIAGKVSRAYPEVRLHGLDLFLDGTFNEINAYPTTIGYSYEYFGIKPEDIILDKLFAEIETIRD